MNKNLQLSILSLCLSFTLSAQNNNPIQQTSTPKFKCGTEVPSIEWDESFNKLVEQHKTRANKNAVVGYTIPVIVHLIHGGQSVGTYPNLGFSQINSQISVLNADFGGTGWNVGNLAATAFSAVGASNTEIRFCAATKNPLGQTLAEPGVERINFNDSAWANPTSFATNAALKAYMDGTVKPKTIWDPQSYFNIWVTDAQSGPVNLLGYATFPAGASLVGLAATGGAQTDGIWVYAQTYGNTGFLMPGYQLGRTATHEVGHWLGLRHIGGDGGVGGNPNGDCAATDYCADTPPQKGDANAYGQNFGNPTYPLNATGASSCAGAPNGSMFMNFMDYVDDGAKYMFTPDQKARMQTAMSTGIYRMSLSPSSATQCTNPASTPTAIINKFRFSISFRSNSICFTSLSLASFKSSLSFFSDSYFSLISAICLFDCIS